MGSGSSNTGEVGNDRKRPPAKRPVSRLQIAVTLGLAAAVGVGIVFGLTKAILTATGIFLAIGADLAFLGFLEDKDSG